MHSATVACNSRSLINKHISAIYRMALAPEINGFRDVSLIFVFAPEQEKSIMFNIITFIIHHAVACRYHLAKNIWLYMNMIMVADVHWILIEMANRRHFQCVSFDVHVSLYSRAYANCVIPVIEWWNIYSHISSWESYDESSCTYFIIEGEWCYRGLSSMAYRPIYIYVTLAL